MATTEILLAGFGGQGVLFAGKILAYCGLMDNKELSWLPSYGPEMRGGTANCSVCISDDPIGSPLVLNPDILIAMNQPSFDKFITEVKPGGKVFYDSTLIEAECGRTDIDIFPIPSSQLAYLFLRTPRVTDFSFLENTPDIYTIVLDSAGGVVPDPELLPNAMYKSFY